MERDARIYCETSRGEVRKIKIYFRRFQTPLGEKSPRLIKRRMFIANNTNTISQRLAETNFVNFVDDVFEFYRKI